MIGYAIKTTGRGRHADAAKTLLYAGFQCGAFPALFPVFSLIWIKGVDGGWYLATLNPRDDAFCHPGTFEGLFRRHCGACLTLFIGISGMSRSLRPCYMLCISRVIPFGGLNHGSRDRATRTGTGIAGVNGRRAVGWTRVQLAPLLRRFCATTFHMWPGISGLNRRSAGGAWCLAASWCQACRRGVATWNPFDVELTWKADYANYVVIKAQ